MINVKMKRPPRAQKGSKRSKSKIALESDIVSVGYWLFQKDFFRDKHLRFVVFYLYALTVIVLQLMITAETLLEFMGDGYEILNVIHMMRKDENPSVNTTTYGVLDQAKLALDASKVSDQQNNRRIFMLFGISFFLLSYMIRLINKNLAVLMHLLADDTKSCGFKLLWSVLLILQVFSKIAAQSACMFLFRIPDASLFNGVANSLGVLVLNELSSYASGVYLMYLESVHYDVIDTDDYMMMDIDTSIPFATFIWCLGFLAFNAVNIIFELLVTFKATFGPLLDKAKGVGNFDNLNIAYTVVGTVSTIFTIFAPCWIALIRRLYKRRLDYDEPPQSQVSPPASPTQQDAPSEIIQKIQPSRTQRSSVAQQDPKNISRTSNQNSSRLNHESIEVINFYNQ